MSSYACFCNSWSYASFDMYGSAQLGSRRIISSQFFLHHMACSISLAWTTVRKTSPQSIMHTRWSCSEHHNLHCKVPPSSKLCMSMACVLHMLPMWPPSTPMSPCQGAR